MQNHIANAKCLVVKIGSSLLVNSQTGAIHQEWFASLIDDIAACWARGQQVVVVSSGAVALGRRCLQLKNNPLKLEEKQAAAAVGQIRLAHTYQAVLEQKGINVAQILLTLDDSENRRRYLNARNTLKTLLNLRIIPIINENDSVATTEICYGDNDRLAARVAQMINADTLVLLSDIEGLYSADPRLYPDAQFIHEVKELTADILAMAGESATEYGSGGMITKLMAAKIALASGCRMVIAAGKHFHPLKQIDGTEKNTWFIPKTTPLNAQKNWLAHHLKPRGFIVVDDGAVNALSQGKSLLAAGIVAIEGEFSKGDAVALLNSAKRELARGLTNYPSHEIKKIMGKKSTEFEKILGYIGYEEIIHRDHLVLLTGEIK